jgi:hypothetical protein
MLFKNTSGVPLNLEAVGLGVLAPGAQVDIPDHLWKATRAHGSARRPSIIERHGYGLVPVDAAFHPVWQTTTQA